MPHTLVQWNASVKQHLFIQHQAELQCYPPTSVSPLYLEHVHVILIELPVLLFLLFLPVMVLCHLAVMELLQLFGLSGCFLVALQLLGMELQGKEGGMEEHSHGCGNHSTVVCTFWSRLILCLSSSWSSSTCSLSCLLFSASCSFMCWLIFRSCSKKRSTFSRSSF